MTDGPIEAADAGFSEAQVLALRNAEAEADPLFRSRWSPKAFLPQAPDTALMQRLFEAARWAPSSFNEQPWRFVWATRDDADWPVFVDLLMEGNQPWAKDAGALVAVFARRRLSRNDKPNATAAFDTGAAWMSLALQARMLGLATHPMGGVHKARMSEELGMPDELWAPQCMVAVGWPGTVEREEQERQPAERRGLGEVARRGRAAGDAF